MTNLSEASLMPPPGTEDSRQTYARLCRMTPHSFAQSVSDWRAFAYQRYISRAIADAYFQGDGRLIINIHPRIGKSEIVSRWTPIWFLDNWPDKRLILTSCGAELAEDHGRWVRNQFEGNTNLMTRMSQDSASAGRWNTTEGGGMIAVGMGGPIMGRGGQLIIIDDTAKNWEDANNFRAQQARVEWFNGTLMNRREPHATVILVEHRTHPDDMSGYLMEHHPDKWRCIRLPALAEAGDLLGRAEGDPLCPERFDKTALLANMASLPKLVWDAMWQQRPSIHGRGLVYQYVQADNLEPDLELRDDLPIQFCFDFNVNPGMHVEIGQYDRHADLFTTIHEVHQMRMKTPDAIEAACKIIEQEGGFGRFSHVEIFGDRSGNTENTVTGDTDYTIIKRKLDSLGVKYIMKVPDANPGVKNRINAANDALADSQGIVHWKIHPRCERLITDMKFLREDEQGLIDKTQIGLSHASDSDTYRIFWLRPIVRPMLIGGRVGSMLD